MTAPVGSESFLLYRVGPGSGLGHVLISVLNAAARARELGRGFAVDAGYFRYCRADQHRR